jgi:hypothetical protein
MKVVVVDRSLTASQNRIILARLGEGFILKRLQIITGAGEYSSSLSCQTTLQ